MLNSSILMAGGGVIPGSAIFGVTSADQSFVVPSDVTSVNVYVWGACGGSMGGSHVGGYGGYVAGILSVIPGETLTIVVGRAGANCPGSSPLYDNAYGGGGKGSGGMCGGGGRSAIRRGATELCTAGGGGGSVIWVNGTYGTVTVPAAYAGGLVGQSGTGTPSYVVGYGGGGGTQSAGGTGGGGSGGNGGQFFGGDCPNGYNQIGSGGGSGYYGGGSGYGYNAWGAGGGGSSWSGSLTSYTILDGSAGTPATSSPYYASTVGVPSSTTEAQTVNIGPNASGRVVITWGM